MTSTHELTALRKLIADTAREVSTTDLVPVVLDDETAEEIARAVASHHPGVMLPGVDLDAVKHPHHPEWGWGGGPDDGRTWFERSHHIVGFDASDQDGVIAYAGNRGLTRDELLPLAAFLVALHTASSEEVLAERYACDCGTDGDHEPYCASLDHPGVIA